MTRDRFSQIGLDRLVRLKWLEKTALLVLGNTDEATIKTILQDDLREYFQSDNLVVRGSIDKTITILLKVWARVPEKLKPLRDSGLEHLKKLSTVECMAVHWGMVMAVYPFWGNVAVQTGRLLKLQGSVTAKHIQRRLRESYGERETVFRRARYVLRSYVDWGVVKESGITGKYMTNAPFELGDSGLTGWILEALLHARPSGSAPFRDLMGNPALFPFRLRGIHPEELVVLSPRLEILRHGLDEHLVMLRK